MPRPPRPSTRYWLFTINNPDEEGEELFESKDPSRYKYAIWQEEAAPETGTRHFQGFLILTRNQNLSYVRNHFFDLAHWDVMRGTAEQCVQYCSKEASRISGPWEAGTKPQNVGQGSRNDLLVIKEKLSQGATDTTIAEEHFGSWIRYGKRFNDYRMLTVKKRDVKSQVIVLIGNPGTGKSYWAHSHSRNIYTVPSGKWFDNYDGVSDVLFDDYNGWVPFEKFLSMLDAYPYQVEIKGGFVNWFPRRIIITANYPVAKWYGFVGQQNIAAVERRIDYLFQSTNPANEREDWGTICLGVSDPYPVEGEHHLEAVETLAELSDSWTATPPHVGVASPPPPDDLNTVIDGVWDNAADDWRDPYDWTTVQWDNILGTDDSLEDLCTADEDGNDLD